MFLCIHHSILFLITEFRRLENFFFRPQITLFSTQGQSLAVKAHTVLMSMVEISGFFFFFIAIKFLMGISDSWEIGLVMKLCWSSAPSSQFRELNCPSYTVFCHRKRWGGKEWVLVPETLGGEVKKKKKKALWVQKAKILFIALITNTMAWTN